MAALTSSQLEQVRRYCENRMVVDYTEPEINSAVQTIQTWLDANRGTLPNQFTSADLSTPQRNTLSNLVGAGFTNTQKGIIFDGVARYHQILPVVPPDQPMTRWFNPLSRRSSSPYFLLRLMQRAQV